MSDEHKDLTTNFGAPVANNQDSLTAGKRGPIAQQQRHLAGAARVCRAAARARRCRAVLRLSERRRRLLHAARESVPPDAYGRARTPDWKHCGKHEGNPPADPSAPNPALLQGRPGVRDRRGEGAGIGYQGHRERLSQESNCPLIHERESKRGAGAIKPAPVGFKSGRHSEVGALNSSERPPRRRIPKVELLFQGTHKGNYGVHVLGWQTMPKP